MVNKEKSGMMNSAGRGDLPRAIAVLLACMMLLMAVPGFARAPKTIDPQVVKAKVEKLGVGEHVMVKRTDGPTLHGHILAIGENEFKIHPDNTSSEVAIAYGNVLKVRKNPGPFTWMIVGAVIAVVIIVAAK